MLPVITLFCFSQPAKYSVKEYPETRKDGTVALSGTSKSNDGKYLAYTIQCSSVTSCTDRRQSKDYKNESKAGHDAGEPILKVLEEQADMYAFILYNMGLEYRIKN